MPLQAFRNQTPLPYLRENEIVIRYLHPEESALMVNFRLKNRHFLKTWEPSRPPEFFTQKYWVRILQQNIQDFHNDDSVALSILNDEESRILGVINYTSIIRGTFQACHLGYALGEDSQGKGIMSNALQSTIDYMFQKKQLHRVMANYMPRNHRSAAVLSRLGFEIEGNAKSFMLINGIWEDHILTSLVNPNDK